MSKGQTYFMDPTFPTVRQGALIRTKKRIVGTNAVGVNETNPELEFGEEEVVVEAGTTCMYVEDTQFYEATKKHPMSAWIRARLIAGDKIIYYTLVQERKRLWDFETYRGKKKMIQAAIEEVFEILQPEEEP